MMGRRRITGARMARELGVSPAWVSYRLTGQQPIDLNDLAAIAEVLHVDVTDLLPARSRRADTDYYPKLTEAPISRTSRPVDNRPNGHAPTQRTRRPRVIGALPTVSIDQHAA
jgi:transcriptional regulator with XRE-family HTH domain